MTTAPRPQIGDLVKEEPDGAELVVTDLRNGQPVVRPLHGGRERPPKDCDALSVVARRGAGGGLPGAGPLR